MEARGTATAAAGAPALRAEQRAEATVEDSTVEGTEAAIQGEGPAAVSWAAEPEVARADWGAMEATGAGEADEGGDGNVATAEAL